MLNLSQPDWSVPDLEDLDIPSLEEIEDVQTQLLRFFDDEEHELGSECPCHPQIQESVHSKSGLLLVHNRYNMISRTHPSLCFLQES